MRTLIKLMLVGFILLNASDSYAGGPWLLKKKSGFLNFQAIPSAYKYTKMLNGTFKEYSSLNREVWNSDYVFYGEFGLTDKLDVIANVPIKFVSTGEPTDSLYFDNLLPEGRLFGISNTEVALKYGLLDKKLKVAISLQASLNTASVDLEKGLATGYQGSSLGLVAHVGGSINDRSYAFFEGGFHKYNNDFSDVVRFQAEYGRQLSPALMFMATLDARHSLENGSYYNENLVQTGLYPNDQSWAVIGVKAAYDVGNGLGFSLGMPLVPIKFKYVGRTGSFAFGIYKKW